jgi:hypothetical protein
MAPKKNSHRWLDHAERWEALLIEWGRELGFKRGGEGIPVVPARVSWAMVTKGMEGEPIRRVRAVTQTTASACEHTLKSIMEPEKYQRARLSLWPPAWRGWCERSVPEPMRSASLSWMLRLDLPREAVKRLSSDELGEVMLAAWEIAVVSLRQCDGEAGAARFEEEDVDVDEGVEEAEPREVSTGAIEGEDPKAVVMRLRKGEGMRPGGGTASKPRSAGKWRELIHKSKLLGEKPSASLVRRVFDDLCRKDRGWFVQEKPDRVRRKDPDRMGTAPWSLCAWRE